MSDWCDRLELPLNSTYAADLRRRCNLQLTDLPSYLGDFADRHDVLLKPRCPCPCAWHKVQEQVNERGPVAFHDKAGAARVAAISGNATETCYVKLRGRRLFLRRSLLEDIGGGLIDRIRAWPLAQPQLSDRRINLHSERPFTC